MNNSNKLIYYRHNINSKATLIKNSEIFYNELTLLFSGSLEYVINGKKIILNSNDILFLPSGSERFRKESEFKTDYVSFNFITDEIINLPVYINSSITNQIRFLIKSCDEIKEHYIEGSFNIIMTLLSCIIKMLEMDFMAIEQNPIVAIMMKYIKQNISKKITLNDIAKIASYSPSYCDILFKKETGKSITDYCIDLRMDEAKRLLLEKGLPLKKIASSLGFEDYNYFARTFKKRTGYTPSEYSLNKYL